MESGFIRALVAVSALLVGLAALAACQGDAAVPEATTVVTSGRTPNASISGTVTYRERLALTPEARLQVQLRDTSLMDAAAPLVAEQEIENPGQVPIKFEVEYNLDDIDSRNTYSIQARITEGDGRLAFINDTAYDVITRGNPRKVDMVLVMVQPPPSADGETVDPNEWVVADYPITGAEILPPHEGDFLRVFFLQSDLENCSRRREQSFEIDGDNIHVSLTHMTPPPAPWAAPCDESLVELDEYINLEDALAPGEAYQVFVNGRLMTTFSRPSPEFPPSEIAHPDVVETTIGIQESLPAQYNLRVIYGIPAGSGCSQENGYTLKRGEEDEIAVTLTYHRVARGEPIMCITDYPTREVSIPLGQDFEPGRKYTVTINGEKAASFTAQ